jgi:hypothetical protein
MVLRGKELDILIALSKHAISSFVPLAYLDL